jgi:hypothetical protein
MAIVRFHVVPNAKSDVVVGQHRDAIKIKLRAPPVEGKANAALRRSLSEELKIPEQAIALERGRTSRHKLMRIRGLTEEQVRGRLLARN